MIEIDELRRFRTKQQTSLHIYHANKKKWRPIGDDSDKIFVCLWFILSVV